MCSYNSMHEKIMHEYENIRMQHYNEQQKKLGRLYEIAPEIQEIDGRISALAFEYASKIISDGITPDDAVCLVKENKEQLEKQRAYYLKLHNINPEQLLVSYNCPVCKDTGFVGNNKCKCYSEVMKKVLGRGSAGLKNINLDIDNDTFENFTLDWYSKETDPKLGVSQYEIMHSVRNECISFCELFKKAGGNLYFYGNSGTGKTFMTKCIVNKLLSQGVNIVYRSAYGFFQFMEDYKFGRTDREAFQAEYNSVYDSDLLIIDDLGTEFITSYTCSVFFDVLNTRLGNKKSTIISSNLNIKNLAERYTERVSSRIIGEFELLRFAGNDIRIAKKFNNRGAKCL